MKLNSDSKDRNKLAKKATEAQERALAEKNNGAWSSILKLHIFSDIQCLDSIARCPPRTLVKRALQYHGKLGTSGPELPVAPEGTTICSYGVGLLTQLCVLASNLQKKSGL